MKISKMHHLIEEVWEQLEETDYDMEKSIIYVVLL